MSPQILLFAWPMITVDSREVNIYIYIYITRLDPSIYIDGKVYQQAGCL